MLQKEFQELVFARYSPKSIPERQKRKKRIKELFRDFSSD